MGACSGSTGCCSFAPLPGGKLPADQTVEGGGQVRVTKSGFDKITQILPNYINSATAAGTCIGEGTALGGILDYCYNDDAQCTPGCHATFGLNSLPISVPDASHLHLHVDAHAQASVPVDYTLGSCTLNVKIDNVIVDADIIFGTDAATGELTVHVGNLNNLQLNNSSYTGCGGVSKVLGWVSDFISSDFGQIFVPFLTSTFDGLIQGMLPHPLGVAGLVDVGSLLAGISPGTQATMEARVVPGGYVDLKNNGLSLGIITGINADWNPATRTPDLDSEPALCVPPLPAPDFAAAPHSLPTTTRSTFELIPANELDGNPDATGMDLAIGISKTTLDLFGHHGVTSGALCLGISTTSVKMLTVGLIGVLAPSVADLGSPDGSDPLLLVTRPQQAIDFDIGDNTDASPALTAHAHHIEIDFYAFLFQRYVRVFTLDLSANLKINLTPTVDPMTGAQQLKPMVSGLDAQNIQVSVINSEFIAEAPSDLEALLPSVLQLVGNQLGNIPPITVPSFAGFSLNNIGIRHFVTNDDFLAITASLGASMSMKQAAAAGDHEMAQAVAIMDADAHLAQPRSDAHAQLRSVDTPKIELIRGALKHSATGRLPSVTFDTPERDSQGRELEWSYNINGGMFHTYRKPVGGQLVISEQMFALPGKYTFGLQSRVVGDYTTESSVSATDVIIDSIGPRIVTQQAAWSSESDDAIFSVPVYDQVSEKAVAYGFNSPGATEPESWTVGATAAISREDANRMAIDGALEIFAKDEAGNVTQVSWQVAPFHGTSGGGGCAGCDTGAGPGAGSIAMILLVGAFIFRKRISKKAVITGALWAGSSVAVSLQPGCSCNHASEVVCETNDDCAGFCPGGQTGICTDNMCSCVLTAGKTGPYSDIAAAPDGTAWVSAYSQTFGDLVVAQVSDAGRIPDTAWEWIDGVPDEPPTVDPSSIRGGITDPGPDTGMYTSIVVAADGTPAISYFDVDNASLMFAQKVNGAWQKHVVDAGGAIDMVSTKSGMYTSMTLTSAGHPGIAYLAHVTDSTGEHAEVRYVEASTPTPTAATDWTQWTVDIGDVPAADPNNPDVYPLPGGLGLFVDSARAPDGGPVIAYYDRTNGDLKLARFDMASHTFLAPKVLDGNNGIDAGWSPSVAVDANGVANVMYVNATKDDFKFITDAANAKSELVDDGYRIVGTSPDGLPKPTFDLVGDDAGIVIAGGAPIAVYQDATTQELLLASRDSNGMWTHTSLAGHTDPWPGAYGFFASGSMHADGINLMISSWVIDQPMGETWVEVFKKPVVIQ